MLQLFNISANYRNEKSKPPQNLTEKTYRFGNANKISVTTVYLEVTLKISDLRLL